MVTPAPPAHSSQIAPPAPVTPPAQAIQPTLPTWSTVPASPRHRSRLPETGVDYPQLLREPARAWWRPIACLALFVALCAVLSGLPILAAIAYATVSGVPDVDLWLDHQLADGAVMDPGGYLFLNLSVIVLIPAVMLSVWAVHRIRPRFVSSVIGGLRWRWLLRCLLALAPLWAVYLAVSTVVDPPQSPRSSDWLALLILGLLLTPWQSAAEEYVFRGWLTQNIGVYLSRPLLAFAIPAVVVAAVFAAAHGSPDPWVLADLAAFSLTASILTWRTGGLEAAIVLHTVNNVGIDVVVNTVGGFAESFVGAETTSTPLAFGVSLLLDGVALALVLWQARRAGVQRRFRPSGHPVDSEAGFAGRVAA